MMASIGLNVLCINNVNVHDPAQLLIEDDLPDLAKLAAIFPPVRRAADGFHRLFTADAPRHPDG